MRLVLATLLATLLLAAPASAATPDQILSGLAAKQTHSWIDNNIGLPAMMTRYKNGGRLNVTCGYVSEIARQLLREQGYTARRVGTVTLQTPDGVNDGHAMIEVFYQGHWQLYDVDANAKAVNAAGVPIQLVQQVAAVKAGTARWQTIATDPLYREDEPNVELRDAIAKVFADPASFYKRVMGFALLPRDAAGTGSSGMYYRDTTQTTRIARYWPNRYHLASPITWYNLTGLGTPPVTAKTAVALKPVVHPVAKHVKRSCKKLRRIYKRTHTKRAHRKLHRCLKTKRRQHHTQPF